MKICVVGAGAIGGYLSAKFALAGQEVTMIDRGAHLKALRRNGITLISKAGEIQTIKACKVVSCAEEAGIHDVVILAVKAHEIESIAPDLKALFGFNTVVVTLQNGIPWWYFQKCGGEFEGLSLKSADPQNLIADNIPVERIIGCVAYPAARIVKPGIICHIEGDRFPVGELDGQDTGRVRMISEMFVKGGFKSPIISDIRSELWLKEWGVVAFNPISALTRSTMAEICEDPLSRELVELVMTEVQTIAHKLGISFRVPMEKRIEGAHKVGNHKTSMLQDLENGNALEIDAIVGAIVELGKLTHTPTPTVNMIYASTKLLSKRVEANQLSVCGEPIHSYVKCTTAQT